MSNTISINFIFYEMIYYTNTNINYENYDRYYNPHTKYTKLNY